MIRAHCTGLLGTMTAVCRAGGDETTPPVAPGAVPVSDDGGGFGFCEAAGLVDGVLISGLYREAEGASRFHALRLDTGPLAGTLANMGRKTGSTTGSLRKKSRNQASNPRKGVPPREPPGKDTDRIGRPTPANHAALQSDLAALVSKQFPDVMIAIEHSRRWNRPCVTFRSAAFVDLLPEERFHRLAVLIPESMRTTRLAGFVWLELAPDETVDQFLKLPRSEDVAPRERQVYAALRKGHVFDRLRRALGASPDQRCRGSFAASLKAMAAARLSAKQIADAKLVFIRHGAYCDCQVIQTVEAALAALYADAA